MKRMSALLSSVIVTSIVGLAPAASARECYLGEVAAFPFNFTPRGWAAADGRLLPIAQNAALFALIGNRFGGDGRTTFALPKVPAIKTAEGGEEISYSVCVQGLFPSRE